MGLHNFFFASYRFNTDGCESILENTQKVFRDGYIDASKAEYFAGLRPVSADDIPIIGKAIWYLLHCFLPSVNQFSGT